MRTSSVLSCTPAALLAVTLGEFWNPTLKPCEVTVNRIPIFRRLSSSNPTFAALLSNVRYSIWSCLLRRRSLRQLIDFFVDDLHLKPSDVAILTEFGKENNSNVLASNSNKQIEKRCVIKCESNLLRYYSRHTKLLPLLYNNLNSVVELLLLLFFSNGIFMSSASTESFIIFLRHHYLSIAILSSPSSVAAKKTLGIPKIDGSLGQVQSRTLLFTCVSKANNFIRRQQLCHSAKNSSRNLVKVNQLKSSYLGVYEDLGSSTIHRLYALELLDLSSNFLFGSIPPKITTMKRLQTIKTLTVLALSQNQISGKLRDMDSLTNPHVLDLRENQLDSELPLLPEGLITVLLSKNSFSGEIPQQFDKLVQLQHLDLSFNFLQGGLPSCLSSAPDNRVVKFGGNCLSIDPKHQHQERYCKRIYKKNRQPGSKDIGVLTAVIGGVVIAMILLAYGFLVLCRRYSQRGTSEKHLLALSENSAAGFSSEIFANASFISEAAKLATQGLPACRLFSLQELKEVINNFDQSAFIGEGSMGKGLKWLERVAVLIGVAKAVHFLHNGMIPGFFNNQLKTNNILLDEHRIAKLKDYGLSMITEETEKIQAKGEGRKWQITDLQDDVYSFGFILLEALVGPLVYGRGKAFLHNELASFGNQEGLRRIVDRIVLTTCSQESLSIVISIANNCISSESMSRPSFEDVLWNLQYATQLHGCIRSKPDKRKPSTHERKLLFVFLNLASLATDFRKQWQLLQTLMESRQTGQKLKLRINLA
ncbi:hypothetical protein NE237_007659 [Protea cynaroides]|uniref:Protein kinase domain-containing protein n=1 Tax=Protea cynaroides TaxID=273540 RepID=A0A9Q0QWB1_9MAGN|nr:hypothetical protein NE237_007659 [Protea cynaroides]